MANTIQLKRSAVASKVPTTTDLALGEIAINTYDGKMYIKKDNGTASIIEVGGSGLPSQTGNSGKYLTTNGTTAGWAAPLPTQTGNSGKYLTTNGSVASWGAVAVDPSLNASGPMVCESDFIKSWNPNVNGYPNPPNIDGFYANTNSSSYPIEHIGGAAGHPGIVRFTSGNANMQLMYGFGGYTSSGSGLFPFIVGNDVDSFTVVVRRSTTGSQGFFGFMDSASASPNNCIGVRLSSSQIYCRTANGGTATESTFTNGIAANTWVQIDVKRNGSNFEFRRNGILVQTISTNIPATTTMAFGVFINNSSTGNVDFDYIGMKTTTLTRY